MERLIKIIRISSKEGFYELKKKSPIFSKELSKNIFITHTFYNHISGYKKVRPIREIIERLSIINLIEKIIKFGKITETRENQKFEKNLFFTKTYKIILNFKNIDFKIIVGEKKNGTIIALSCFIGNF